LILDSAYGGYSTPPGSENGGGEISLLQTFRPAGADFRPPSKAYKYTGVAPTKLKMFVLLFATIRSPLRGLEHISSLVTNKSLPPRCLPEADRSYRPSGSRANSNSLRSQFVTLIKHNVE